MRCTKCQTIHDDWSRFCRKCGADSEALRVAGNHSLQRGDDETISKPSYKDPDELTGNGIGSVIIGDGFFMVAVLLSATQAPVSSLLWLLLLIPAFFFFGKGFADVLHAKQIRRRLKLQELDGASAQSDLPPPRASISELIKDSGELLSNAAQPERQTRKLDS